ncbi:hypothetical protein MA16_Dca011048 [Dendrobium catenatum]|uniref:Uncharacterized protein n=1 Tax=Dendrobium catenatum TaxID=906689 RepID=A0A2I0WCI4_9ASPA|nr:hypothetical protein MA16_Dca011048 [Dendrobium catenatum]
MSVHSSCFQSQQSNSYLANSSIFDFKRALSNWKLSSITTVITVSSFHPFMSILHYTVSFKAAISFSCLCWMDPLYLEDSNFKQPMDNSYSYFGDENETLVKKTCRQNDNADEVIVAEKLPVQENPKNSNSAIAEKDLLKKSSFDPRFVLYKFVEEFAVFDLVDNTDRRWNLIALCPLVAEMGVPLLQPLLWLIE